MRGNRGRQQGQGAGGEGCEVFAVDHGVDLAPRFHHVLVGLQIQERLVERHWATLGRLKGVARVVQGDHVAVANFVDLGKLFNLGGLA